LIVLISGIGMLPLLTVNAKSTLTLENMCKFKLSIVEAVQVGSIGVYSVYVLGYYATRQERNVGDAEALIKVGMLLIVSASFIAGTILKKGEDSEDGEDVASRQSSVSSRGSDIGDRISVGARKGVWEGGMKGARGLGRIKRASTRGIAKETEWRDERIGKEEDDEATFNPGMI